MKLKTLLLGLGLTFAFAFSAFALDGIPSTFSFLPGPALQNGTALNAILNQIGPQSSCSGTTTASCTSYRNDVSITGLTTAAAGTTSAAMTVTNALAKATSSIVCAVNSYGGAGVPLVTTIVPAAGSYSFTVTNVAASGSLNATVTAFCMIWN